MPEDAHLQLIQTVIARLSSQSTAVKAWCVTVTAALLSFAATATTPGLALIAVYVVIAFAVLDAYYLSLERAYRRLYQHAVDEDVDTWSLTTGSPRPREVLAALRSPAVSLLYGSNLVVVLGAGGYLLTRH
ncbi:hypothetical protein NLX85_18270 [Micromonospora sp. A3M-1-15]|uniref:hypothetical protein n=1 Tax=Micromonospora sp. A3M-1-15 TaxID=2962035 RepID=UPI0020B67787|nr:hypothetical protein [Micromonospora sp. A3M-1-15]MCP3785309.1 hypothetical protein [Micromonospora sp. A3M-1-15]